MKDSSLGRRMNERRQHRLTPPEQLETRRLLAVFNVNSFQDTVDADLTDGLALDASGNTSLRAAVMQANWSPGDDEINLPSGNYPLELLFSDPDNSSSDDAGDLDITDDTGLTTIRGAGPESTTIDATAVSERVLHVHSAAELHLSGVALVGGFESEGLGGGLLLEGASTLQAIHVDSNRAASGGGIFDRSGELVITQSTISNNTAIIDGGGIAFAASFSGPDGAAAGVSSLINSTVSGNSTIRGSGGGISFDSSVNRSINLTHVTIASNSAELNGGVSGPIFEPSMVTVQASIIANNFSPDELDLGGVFTSRGSNVIGAAEPETGFLDGENNDLVGSSSAPVDPLLQPLSAFSFSPLPVHRLRLASPAVDRVDVIPIPAEVDQRNRSRTLDAAPDSGAFEFVGGTILIDTFHDIDRNAIRDPDESSAFFDFELFVTGELVDGSTVQFSSTGYAPLSRLEEGVYSIDANFFDTDRVLPTLTDATIVISEEFVELAEFAGYRYGEIYGYKFGDRAGDSQDDDDPRLAGIRFDLIELGLDGQLGTADDRLVGQSTTDEDGAFSFRQLLDGNYRVIENLPENRINTTAPVPSLQVVAGSLFSPFESPEADPLQTVVVEPTLAVGNALPAALRGRVFFDVSRDGFDPTDPGISAFTVSLFGAGPDGEFGSDDDPAPLTIVSAADGTYSFDTVSTPGPYRISLTLRDQYFSTTESSFDIDLRLNDVIISDLGRRILLAEEQTELINPSLNFGVSRSAAIQGTIFDDLNADGNRLLEMEPPIPDPGENGRGGQRVDLYRQQPSGEFLLVESAVSVDAPGTPLHGFFEFAVFEAGTYAIDQILTPDRGLTSSEAPFDVQPGRYYVSTTIDASDDAVEDFEDGIVPIQPVALLDAGSRGLVELTGSIGDDPDADGILGVEEVGLADWQVVLQRTERLYHQDEFPDTRSVTTDAQGDYSLFVWPGQYEIAQILEPGFEPTGPQYRFENFQGVASGSGSSVSKVSGLTLADLDGDSIDDLVVVNDFADIADRTSSLEVHYSNAMPSVVLPLGEAMRPQHVEAFDIDGDQDLDLVVAAAGEGSLNPDIGLDLAFGDILIFRNDEGTLNRINATGQIDSFPPRTGNEGRPVADSLGGNSPRFLSYGDLNNDDRVDLVVVNGFSYDPQSNPSVSHEEDISIVFQNDEGGFEKVQTIDISTDSTAARVLSTAVGDVNGDGLNDIAVAVQGLNRVDIYWGSREGEFPSVPSKSLEGLQRPTHVVAQDLDLDGLTDLLVADYDADELLVFPQSNQGLEDSPIRIASSQKPQWLAIGDVNADSSPDILISIASSNAVQPIYNLGDHRYSAAATVPTNMHISAEAPNGLSVAFGKLAIGNLDGDAFADLAVAHFSSGASTHPNLLQTYSTWMGMHPPADAEDLLGNEDYFDFAPDGGGGIPPVSIEPSAATIGHRDSIGIASFTANDFTPEVNSGDFANLNVGIPTLPPSQQVLAAEPLNLPKHNYTHPLDVNQDDLVSPIDVLHIIAELNSEAAMIESSTLLTDPSGDGHVSALDALLVVNYLNTNQPDEEYIVRQQITPQNLVQIRDAYVDILFDAGLSEQLADMLKMVPFRIADLPGNVLAQTRDGVITVDINAAGWGWQLDANPSVDFDLIALEATSGKRRADLLSTIAHELGHVLGFDENFDDELSIMQPRLGLGERTVHDQAIQELLLAYEQRHLD